MLAPTHPRLWRMLGRNTAPLLDQDSPSEVPIGFGRLGFQGLCFNLVTGWCELLKMQGSIRVIPSWVLT
jgi:hypothetical protein